MKSSGVVFETSTRIAMRKAFEDKGLELKSSSGRTVRRKLWCVKRGNGQ